MFLALERRYLAKAIAKSIAGKFTRVQFTPDLLPSDIIGSSIYHEVSSNFRPVPFSQMLY